MSVLYYFSSKRGINTYFKGIPTLATQVSQSKIEPPSFLFVFIILPNPHSQLSMSRSIFLNSVSLGFALLTALSQALISCLHNICNLQNPPAFCFLCWCLLLSTGLIFPKAFQQQLASLWNWYSHFLLTKPPSLSSILLGCSPLSIVGVLINLYIDEARFDFFALLHWFSWLQLYLFSSSPVSRPSLFSVLLRSLIALGLFYIFWHTCLVLHTFFLNYTWGICG